MEKSVKDMYDKAGSQVCKALKARHFEAYYAVDREKARELVLRLIPQNHTVGWGGTMTVDQLGIKEALEARGTVTIDRDKAKNPAERVEIMKKAMLADTFLMSSNAITQDGQLFNIDGAGNRLAALCYGPESVIVIAGMNKVVPDMESAVKRVRNFAAPANAQRFDVKTPCKVNGICADCVSLDCICGQLVQTRVSHPAGRIKVILVGDDLGI